MNKQKTTWMILSIFMIAACAFALHKDVKASAVTDAKAAYQRLLEKSYSGGTRYRIIDVDKNKIPELIIRDYNEPAVYTYNSKTKNVKKLATGFSGFAGPWYSTKKHVVVLINHGSGWTYYTFYKIRGLKAKKTKIYKATKNYNTGKYIYKINKKKVNEKKWNAKLKKELKAYIEVK